MASPDLVERGWGRAALRSVMASAVVVACSQSTPTTPPDADAPREGGGDESVEVITDGGAMTDDGDMTDDGAMTDGGVTVDVVAADGGAAPSQEDAGLDVGDAKGEEPPLAYAWDLPRGFPVPSVPDNNPMSAAKVELGRHLFYDVRLSHNQSQSCATCHRQELAFTDGRPHAVGSTGIEHPRSAMSLANVAYASTLTWANPLQLDLEHQALIPMFGDDPIELGLPTADELVQRLSSDALYSALFPDAWPGETEPVTIEHVVQALASFERTMISGNSPFDRWQYSGDKTALSPEAMRGYQVFNDEDVGCTHCHVGFALTDHVHWNGKAFFEKPYHNTGLYNIDGKGAYPEPNTGVYHVTGHPEDMGRFKAPTLRNVAVTAPYMHDGSIATLDEVLDHYQAGGRTIASGPKAGIGSLSPLKDSVIRPFTLSVEDRAALIAFLNSLTDETFLNDARLGPP